MIIVGPVYENPARKYLKITLERSEDTVRVSRRCRVSVDFSAMLGREPDFRWSEAEVFARRYAQLLGQALQSAMPTGAVMQPPSADEHLPKVEIAMVLPEHVPGRPGERVDEDHIDGAIKQLFNSAHASASADLGDPIHAVPPSAAGGARNAAESVASRPASWRGAAAKPGWPPGGRG